MQNVLREVPKVWQPLVAKGQGPRADALHPETVKRHDSEEARQSCWLLVHLRHEGVHLEEEVVSPLVATAGR